LKKPILVTGSHKSGTTWVGKMISLSNEIGYIHEPFNPKKVNWRPGLELPYWFCHIDNNYKNAKIVKEKLLDLLNYKFPYYHLLHKIKNYKEFLLLNRESLHFLSCILLYKRPLIKDPIAFFSTEWLYKQFNMDVVILIRHPAAFVSSIILRGWEFSFDNFLEQKSLMKKIPEKYRKKIEIFTKSKKDKIDQAILLWRIIYYFTNQYRKKYPNWIFLKHENLSKNPVGEFEKLYKRLSITYNQKIMNKIIEYTNCSNKIYISINSKRNTVKRNSERQIGIFHERLSKEEILYIKKKSKDIWPYFYTNEDW